MISITDYEIYQNYGGLLSMHSLDKILSCAPTQKTEVTAAVNLYEINYNLGKKMEVLDSYIINIAGTLIDFYDNNVPLKNEEFLQEVKALEQFKYG